jgi:hypothetical protein
LNFEGFGVYRPCESEAIQKVSAVESSDKKQGVQEYQGYQSKQKMRGEFMKKAKQELQCGGLCPTAGSLTKAKMRTLDMAWEEIKTAAPNTSLSKYSLRRILMSGQVPTVRGGG